MMIETIKYLTYCSQHQLELPFPFLYIFYLHEISAPLVLEIPQQRSDCDMKIKSIRRSFLFINDKNNIIVQVPCGI